MKHIIELASNESFGKTRMLGLILDSLIKNTDYEAEVCKRADVWIYKFGEDYEIRLVPLSKRFLNKARKFRKENNI